VKPPGAISDHSSGKTRGKSGGAPVGTILHYADRLRPDADWRVSVTAPLTPVCRPNHFWLTRGFDTNRYPDGGYVLEVEASDVRGNPSTASLTVTFTNAKHNP
jgi:hypothetical protein